MHRCIFENLTLEQARALANWFESEQYEYFEIHGLPAPTVKKKFIDNGDVIVECETKKS